MRHFAGPAAHAAALCPRIRSSAAESRRLRAGCHFILSRAALIGVLLLGPASVLRAANWTTNTADAVNLFSGTVSPNKITLAGTYASDIINGDPRANPPIDGYYGLAQPVGHQLENMALVLYGGWLTGLGCGSTPSQTCLQSQYYIPFCSGTEGTTKYKGNTDLTCSTGWIWAVNSNNQPGGLNYVGNIMNNLQNLQ